MYPNFETVFIPKHKPEILMTLTDEKTPKLTNAAVDRREIFETFSHTRRL
jgi:hypothetical protein